MNDNNRQLDPMYEYTRAHIWSNPHQALEYQMLGYAIFGGIVIFSCIVCLLVG